jgi:TonB family protein
MPHRAVCLLLALLLALPAGAQDAPAEGTPTGVLTKPPTLLKQVEARFPPEAAAAGVAGTVVMEVDIGADGKVLDARVVQPAGHGFDEAALEAVRQFEFTPAEVDGQPSPVRIQYAYEFLYRPQVVETPPAPQEEQVNFAGLLLERGTRKPLAGATVVVDAGGQVREALSGEDGRFELKGVPAGTWPVVVTGSEYSRYEVRETFSEDQRTEVTYYVRRKQYGANETVVRGRAERKEVAQVSLRQEEVRLIPGTQGDALKVVQNLPGVARSPFGAGLLVVRGGKPWDTRVYVDDELVPQLFHFGGLYATFNSNLLEDISFQPGNFGAEHGRNIGGLVRAATRTPAQDALHGYLDLNIIDVSALVEGPLGNDWAFSVSGRRSHVDAVLPWALDTFVPQANALSFTVAPRYYDYQLRVERRRPGSRERLAFSFFGSNDQLSLLLSNPAFDAEGRGSINTLQLYNRLTFRWDKPLGEGLTQFTRASVGIDRNAFSAGSDLYVRSTLFPLSLRHGYELELPQQNLTLSAGLDVLVIPYIQEVQAPPPFKLNRIPDPFVSRQLLREDATRWPWEPGAYLEAVWKPLEGLKLIPGVRVDYESTLRRTWVDPRLAAFWEVRPGTTLKAATGLYRQPPDYRIGALSPTFGNPDLLPEGARHYAVGVEQQFTDALGMDVQLYYKDLFDQAQSVPAPSSGTDGSGAALPNYASTGTGRSYGVELLVRHQLTRNFFGWLAYSLSRTDRRSARTGQMTRGSLDQPHNLVAVASYKLPHDFIAGVRLRFSSGPLDTPYVGAVYDANANYYFPLLGEPNSRRLPSFFQADVRVDKRFVYEQWMMALYVDVQNVTNRQNVEGVMNNFDYSQERYLYGLPIIPSLGVRGEF